MGAGTHRRGTGTHRRGAGTHRRGAGTHRRGAGTHRRGTGTHRLGAGTHRRGAGTHRRGAGTHRRGTGLNTDTLNRVQVHYHIEGYVKHLCICKRGKISKRRIRTDTDSERVHIQKGGKGVKITSYKSFLKHYACLIYFPTFSRFRILSLLSFKHRSLTK